MAEAMHFHFCRSAACLAARPQVRCISRNFPTTVLIRVVFSRPRFRFPSYVHFKVVFGYTAFRNTCPSPSSFGEQIIRVNLCSYVQQFFGGNLLWPEYLHYVSKAVWKADSCLISISVVRQHSEPYTGVAESAGGNSDIKL